MEEGRDANTVSVGQYIGYFQVPKHSHFQNKAKCEIFLVKMRFLRISYRGAILWNTVFYRKVKKDSYFKELDFSAQSVQSLPRHYQDFKCFSLFLFLDNLLRGN